MNWYMLIGERQKMASSVEEMNEVVCLELPAPSGWKKKLLNQPREQVADVEILLGLTNAVYKAAKTQGIGYISPSKFVSLPITQFGDWTHEKFGVKAKKGKSKKWSCETT